MKILLNIILFPFVCIKNLIDDMRVSILLKNTSINSIDNLNGLDFELIMAYIFKKMHFRVKHTPNSGDYGADLIVYKWGISLAIQCKLYYNHNVGNKAVNEVYGAARFYNCDYAIVLTNSHFTHAAVTLAQSLNVVLLDRNILVKLLNKPYRNNAKIVKNAILMLSQNKIM